MTNEVAEDLELQESDAVEENLEPNWVTAVRAVQEKQGTEIKVLDLRPVTSFTDYFIICTGSNPKQNQAISDEILRLMKLRGERPIAVEGYDPAEWILLDYADFIVHVFSVKGRAYYDLDRLWKAATPVAIPAE